MGVKQKQTIIHVLFIENQLDSGTSRHNLWQQQGFFHPSRRDGEDRGICSICIHARLSQASLDTEL